MAIQIEVGADIRGAVSNFQKLQGNAEDAFIGITKASNDAGDAVQETGQKIGSSFKSARLPIGQATDGFKSFGNTVGLSLDHIASRSSTARFAVQNLSNVLRDVPFGINNPAIFSTALDHVVASMTMLREEASSMNAATGSSQTAFGLLKQSLAGGGGLLLAFNGISLALTFLGPKLISLFESTMKGTGQISEHARAVKLLAEEYEIFNSIEAEANKDAGTHLSKLNVIYNATQDVTKSIQERVSATELLKSTYPDTFANLTNEAILAGKAATAYEQLTAQILNTARTEAGMKQLSELSQQRLDAEEKRQKVINATNQELAKVKPISGVNFLGEKVLSEESIRQKFEYDRNVILDRRNKALKEQDNILEDISKKEKFIVGVVGQKNLVDIGQTKAAADSVTGLEEKLKGLKAQYDALSAAERKLPIGENLVKQIKDIEKQLKDATDNISIKPKKEKHTNFLFDVLGFDPNGKLKVEDRKALLDSIDKFQKDFGSIIQGALFTGNDNQRIAEAKKLDVEIKAGNVKFDLKRLQESIKENFDKNIKEALPPEGFQSFIPNSFFGDGKSNLFGDLNLNAAQSLDIFKFKLKQIGAKIPSVIESVDEFGHINEIPVRVGVDPKLLDASFKMIAADLKARKDAFFSGLKNLLESSEGNIAINLGQGIADAISGNGLDNAFKNVANIMGDFLQELGKLLIKEAITVELFKKAFATLLKNPIAAIGVGIGLVALGGIIKNTVMPKPKAFAAGGLVAGPTLALIGEGRGTSRNNPEVVAPLDKLQKILGGSALGSEGSSSLVARVEGKDLLLVLQRATGSQNRNFGR